MKLLEAKIAEMQAELEKMRSAASWVQWEDFVTSQQAIG